MGARGSTLIGAACPDPRLLRFTSLTSKDLTAIRARHKHDLGNSFALGPKQFRMLLQIEEKESAALFKEVFDTDRNNLVDAFEVLSCLAILSRMRIAEKVSFIYSLYDFNGSGDITMDEMTILMRTLVVGTSKLDKRITPPSTEEVERLALKAFSAADRDSDGEIPKHEFDNFSYTHPMVRDFLDYWRGSVNQVVLAPGERYVDPDFPPSPASLYKSVAAPPSGMPPPEVIKWKRLGEFAPGSRPSLFTAGPLALNLQQGPVATRWLTAALGMVSSSSRKAVESLFVHTGQEDAGRYCCRFYKEGTWHNVVVDDHVPSNGVGEPLFLTSGDRAELWPSIVEKAYAKCHGSYEAIVGGKIEYALRDLTGGKVDVLDKSEDPKFVEKAASGAFFETLKRVLADGGIVGATCNDPDYSVIPSAPADPSAHPSSQPPPPMPLPPVGPAVERAGVLRGAGYGVVEAVEFPEKRLRLVKVANPWMDGGFVGDWSPNSDIWDSSPDVARTCKFQRNQTGFFWMKDEDFARIFNTFYLCKTYPEDTWQHVRREGTFPKVGGGCVNFTSWIAGDQILLDVTDDTEIVFTLTQQDSRYHRDGVPDSARPALGILCHRHAFGDIDVGATNRLTTIRSTAIKHISPFMSAREVTCAGKLEIGKYVVLPQTFNPNAGTKYWVNIASKERVNVYGGSEINWDPTATISGLEGENEMEQDLAEEPVSSNNSSEVDNETAALQGVAKMVAELSLLAQQLGKKKRDLEARLSAIENR